MQEVTVSFKPLKRSVRVAKGTDVLTAAAKAGIVLSASCGGEGLCGKCRIMVTSGAARSERSRLVSDADRKRGVVLACQTVVEGNVEVTIPRESLGLHEHIDAACEEFTKGSILKEEKRYRLSPLVRKIYLELPQPTSDDNVSDLDRIHRELEGRLDNVHISTKLANVKHLSELLRSSDFKVTATLGYKDDSLEILAVEPGDTTKADLGFAFDIGTTTVVGQLVNLNTKEILGTRITFNRQASFGSDVITRIIYGSNPEGLEELNKAVFENIHEITADLSKASNVNFSDIYAAVFAGNMTMLHLLLKIDPSNIRKAPYIPTTTAFASIPSSDLDLEMNPKGIAAFFPGVSTYIGGDIVAGILACGLAESEDISLLADIGTNGEIVLGNKDWMMGVAASAGPAFEGSGLKHGMKAVRGAIDRVTIDEKFDVKFGTIGGQKAKGICGSGYIDLLCQMLKKKIIGKDGRIDRDMRSKRVRKTDTGYEFVVAFREEAAIGSDIVIEEDDIENLKRAKGAMYSAIVTLLKKVEKEISEVRRIYIAGGFGNYLNIENAIFIGLLPDIERSVYEFIGNSSLAGSRIALLSHEAFARANEICKNITYLDLSSEPSYMDEYIAALFFPHTDIGRFSSVRL